MGISPPGLTRSAVATDHPPSLDHGPEVTADPSDREGVVLDLPRAQLDLSRSIAVMGIVNVTPDSFYDGGATAELTTARDRVLQFVTEGAAIVDVGGVRGGPGTEVSIEEEIGRVRPLIEAVRERDTDVLLSVDTFRAPVAAAAMTAGADIVNDVGSGHDPELLDVAAEHRAGYLAMHHGGSPRTRPFRRGYDAEVVAEVVERCRELAEQAQERGVDRRRVIVDPGHDFQKTTYHSLELTRRLPELTALGYPVLVALSNKDFIGETLDAPLDQRVDASIAAAVFAILRGASIVRVHEVARTVTAVRMTEALLGWTGPEVAVRGLE
jgi:dihydropteroate synthase